MYVCVYVCQSANRDLPNGRGRPVDVRARVRSGGVGQDLISSLALKHSALRGGEHTYIHTGIYRQVHTYTHTYIHTGRQADRLTYIHTYIHSYTERHT